MAYTSGIANNMGEVLTALRNFLVANGWTLSGDVLHKGDCHAELVNTDILPQASGSLYLRLRVGNGIDGSNALVDPSPLPSYLGPALNVDNLLEPWTWPATYHIHANSNPDEVWVALNYHATHANNWGLLGFGQSPEPGNAGSGCWQFAPLGQPRQNDRLTRLPRFDRAIVSFGGGRYTVQGGLLSPVPFFIREVGMSTSGQPVNGYVHGVIDDDGSPQWSPDRYSWRLNSGIQIGAHEAMMPLLEYGLNSWNLEAPLIRIRILQRRPESKTSIIATMEHARMCRNDYIGDGGIVALGPDRWKVYPCYRKNAAQRNGSAPSDTAEIDHSGTIALAIRYDGP